MARLFSAVSFTGVEAEDQQISPRDPQNSVHGSAVGLKVQAENWWDLSLLWFLSLDASYGTAFQQYWSLARVGRRLGARFSLGFEAGALGNEEHDVDRGGGFVRMDLRPSRADHLRRCWVHCRPRPSSAGVISVTFAKRSAHLGRAFCVREPPGLPKRESPRR